MNRLVWRNDKEIMVLVNSSGASVLSSMDGNKVFSEVVEEAFKGQSGEVARANPADLKQFSLASEYEDRFLQSAAFMVALWSRGFVNFLFKGSDIESIPTSPIVRKIAKAQKPLTVFQVLGELSAQYKQDFRKLYAAFHQEQAQINMLLVRDMLIPVWEGEAEPFDKPDVIPDTVLPQYGIGYVKPSLIEKLGEAAHGDGAKVEPATAIAAITVTTTVTAFSEMIGDSVGTAESQ